MRGKLVEVDGVNHAGSLKAAKVVGDSDVKTSWYSVNAGNAIPVSRLCDATMSYGGERQCG